MTGLIRMPNDCGKCVILLFVGSGLMFMFMLLLGLFYFLMFIQSYESTTRVFVGLIATLSPSILLTIFLVTNYYDPERTQNSDFEIASPAIVTTFCVSIWTFYLYMKNKLIDNQHSDEAGS